MNVDEIQSMSQAMRQEQLDPERKRLIRMMIAGHMASYPLPLPKANIFKRMFLARSTMVAFAVIVLVIAGSSALYASASAGPGDSLYSFRIKVTEPLALAVTFSEEDKADLVLAQVEDRIIEQEQLRVLGQTEVAAQHQDLLDQKFAQLESQISKLEKSGRSGKALEVASRLEASVAVHEQMDQSDLSQSSTSDKDQQTTDDSKDQNSSREYKAASTLRSTSATSVKQNGQSVSESQAKRRIDKTTTLLNEVQRLLDNNSRKLGKKPRARLRDELANARKQLDEAKELLNSDQFSESVLMSAKASATAQRAKVLIGAELRTGGAVFREKSEDEKSQTQTQNQPNQSQLQIPSRLDQLFDDLDRNSRN